MPKLKEVVETFFADAEATIKADLAAGWAELEPAIVALGKTVLGQVATAAGTLILNPSSVGIAEAVASVMAQLPADAKVLETAVAGAIAAQVAAKMAVAPATPPAAQ